MDEHYSDLLAKLTENWMSLEIKHRCSKRASDDFWNLAKDAFPMLQRAKIDAGVYREIPLFTSLRRKLHKEKVPPVNLEICYLNKSTKETVTVEGHTTPVSRFNPTEHEKLYEVATVEVILYPESISFRGQRAAAKKKYEFENAKRLLI